MIRPTGYTAPNPPPRNGTLYTIPSWCCHHKDFHVRLEPSG